MKFLRKLQRLKHTSNLNLIISDQMSKKIDSKLLALLLFFILILFIRINSGEMQPWDEGLYAMRAKAVLQYHEIIDQSNHSIGGLYSATYPPLTVWAIAASISFFGESLLAIRLYSIICSTAAMIFLFSIVKRLFEKKFSYLVIFALAGTLAWNTYSRQAMTDVPLTSFFIISLWSLIKINDSEKQSQFLICSAVFAVSFAAALMTKILISFLPLIFVGIYLFEKNKLKNKIWLLSASALSVIIALPWHIYMISHHGWEFLRSFTVPHLYSAVESNIQQLGAVYYFNQLIVSNPFFILSLAVLVIFIFRFKRFKKFTDDQNDFFLRIILVWFGGLLIIFTIAVTKLPHYVVYMIPPALILSGLYYKKLNESIKNDRIRWIIFSLLVLSFIWSISFELRQNIKLILSSAEINLKGAFYLLLILILLIITILGKREFISKILKYSFIKLSYLFLIVLVARTLLLNALFPPGNIFGAKTAADVLSRMQTKSFVYLYHEHNISDSLNPQLAWYTRGWTSGWVQGKTFKPISMKENTVNFKVLDSTNNYPDLPIVYFTSQDSKLTRTVVNNLAGVRQIISQEKNYIIFGYKKSVKASGYLRLL